MLISLASKVTWIGIGMVISGLIVAFFSNDPSFAKWITPFGFGLIFLSAAMKYTANED